MVQLSNAEEKRREPGVDWISRKPLLLVLLRQVVVVSIDAI